MLNKFLVIIIIINLIATISFRIRRVNRYQQGYRTILCDIINKYKSVRI